jgi:hypothetical protein
VARDRLPQRVPGPAPAPSGPELRSPPQIALTVSTHRAGTAMRRRINAPRTVELGSTTREHAGSPAFIPTHGSIEPTTCAIRPACEG